MGNVQVYTNYPTTYGMTNVLFTDIHGAMMYSLTNNMNNTNVVAPGAFQDVTVYPDLNGDFNPGCTISVTWGNTNLLPFVATNSAGQFFVSNNVYNGPYPWPATTNYYATYGPNATNVLTFIFVRVPDGVNGETITNGAGASIFSFVTPAYNYAPTNSFTISTNVPAAFLQGVAKIRLQQVTVTGAQGANSNMLINGIKFNGFVP